MPTPQRIEKIKKAIQNRQKDLIVVIEDISDPHNAMAIVRTCEAFGIQEVHFIFERENRFNAKKKGKVSSASASNWVDFFEYTTTKECLTSLKKKGFILVGTALTDQAKNFFESELTHKKIALVFGNEHTGLSSEAIALLDSVIMIPMQGMIQSLNVSVTAALCIYETTRQRRHTRGDWSLSEQEQQDLMNRWLKLDTNELDTHV